MSLWRGILQQRRDEWTSSLRGLDGIEAKPKIYNENIPVFRHNEPHLVVRRELRSEEAYLKTYTPFKNKKDAKYLERIRAEWLGSNLDDDLSLEGFLAQIRGELTAGEAYEAQDDLGSEHSVGISEGEAIEEETESEIDRMWRLDEWGKVDEGAEPRGTFVGGGAGTGTAGGGGGSAAEDVANLEELGEEGNLDDAVQNLKSYGITTRGELENFVLGWEADVRGALEKAKVDAKGEEGGMLERGKISSTDKHRIIEMYRVRMNISRLTGKEDAKSFQARMVSFIRGQETIPTAKEKPIKDAWAKSGINKDRLRDILKDWKASPEGKAKIKATPGLADYTLLGGRDNYNVLYELLAELGIKPPGYTEPVRRVLSIKEKASVGGGAGGGSSGGGST